MDTREVRGNDRTGAHKRYLFPAKSQGLRLRPQQGEHGIVHESVGGDAVA